MASRKLNREWISEVLALRAKGWSISSIAKYYGVSQRKVWQALERASRQWDIDVEAMLRVERRVTIEQIDQIIESLSTKAESTDDPRHIKLMMDAIKMKSDLLGLEREEGVQRQSMRIWQELAKQVSLFKRTGGQSGQLVEPSVPALPEKPARASDFDPAGLAYDLEQGMEMVLASTHQSWSNEDEVVEVDYSEETDETENWGYNP